MKQILLLGAGLSTTSLINYLLDHAESEDWFIKIGDINLELIGLKEATPAQILQKKLEEKWSLNPDDKDMIVMEHVLEW